MAVADVLAGGSGARTAARSSTWVKRLRAQLAHLMFGAEQTSAALDRRRRRRTLAPPSLGDALHADNAFQDYFWRFERRIFGYLWHLTSDEQAALDLSQETFLRAWQHFDAIAAHRESGAWLFRVASNLAFRYLRRRRAPVGAAVPLHESHATTGDAGNDIVERDLVRQTLRALTPKQRAVLVLHEIYGLSGPEIGRALGMSPSAVKMALLRARERFRMEYLDVDVVEERRA